MTDAIIQVDGLGKRYVLGQAQEGARYRTLRESLVETFRAPFRRREKPGAPSRQATDFWALRDVSFEVRRGEVLGIIGRNGAGKSTLLKVLSRITEPTTGRIRIGGRVASLLEVGTGFHPELTGRENIFLNGAILGMHRAEIKAKFDEIVAFAEVEKFLDTPVKRYSSGMYVRLAFAVAAHLEPEILIVDEVLAVGDVDFQRKCLGKMQDVAKGQGRTVLFVSHNMGAVRSLCSTGIVMRQGKIILKSNIAEAVDGYLAATDTQGAIITWEKASAPAASYIRFRRAFIRNASGEQALEIDNTEPFDLCLEYEVLSAATNLRIGFFMQTAEGTNLCGSNDESVRTEQTVRPGVYTTRCRFPGHVLNAGTFYAGFGADTPGHDNTFVLTEPCLYFNIVDHHGHGPRKERLPGIIQPELSWQRQAA